MAVGSSEAKVCHDRAAAILLLGTVPAMQWLIDIPSGYHLVAVACGMEAMVGLSGGASLAAVTEIFPARVRALDLSIGYAVGGAIFGGSTQFCRAMARQCVSRPYGNGMVLCRCQRALSDRHGVAAGDPGQFNSYRSDEADGLPFLRREGFAGGTGFLPSFPDQIERCIADFGERLGR